MELRVRVVLDQKNHEILKLWLTSQAFNNHRAEKNLSTQKKEKKKSAWFPRKNELSWRASCSQGKKSEKEKEINGLGSLKDYRMKPGEVKFGSLRIR